MADVERCSKCKSLFEPGSKKMKYKDDSFHNECFCCTVCKNPIGASSFNTRDNGDIVCVSCYDSNFASKCNKCREVIKQGGVIYKDNSYHKECFTCTKCKKELSGQKFTSKEEAPYCADCFTEEFAKVCDGCRKHITSFGEATNFVTFEDRNWHTECFNCHKCSKALSGKGFQLKDGNVMCGDCQ